MSGPAERLRLFDFSSAPMRAFHVTWVAFFACFFGWFAAAPLMPIIRAELALTPAQLAHLGTAAVAVTVGARLVVGAIADRIGPRRTYAGLLVVAALPLLCAPLCTGYASLLALRLVGGIAGASFVVTQLHTSLMFAPGCVGTANATAAGWGNLGGGAAQALMPLLVALLGALGLSTAAAWRGALVVPGVALLACAFAYPRLTRDLPHGNVATLRALGLLPPPRPKALFAAARDLRVWALALVYGGCFGVEIAVDNVAALHFRDRWHLSLAGAGAVAALFGGTNLFARALGGVVGDRVGARFGLRGRFAVLAALLTVEAVALAAWARADALAPAIAGFVGVGLAVAMASGATYAIVPFLDPRAIGSVSGLVGAGGNLGAVAASLALGGVASAHGLALLTAAVAALAPVAALAGARRSSPAPVPSTMRA